MKRIWRRSVAVAALLTTTATLGEARAEPSDGEEALAETLYRQGRQLMTDGRLDQACAKFAESQRLDPASGTLLNLAACHEAKHMFASAWLEYTEAKTWARRDQRADRVAYAEERIHVLEPKVSHLTVSIDAAADAPAELQIEVDGIRLRAAAHEVPIPVDPGVHRVDARAPGRKPWSQQVIFGEAPTNVTVTLPPLELLPLTPPIVPVVAPPAASEPGRPIPWTVYAVGGVTVGAAAGSAATGIWFLAKKAQYEKTADEGDWRAARTAGIANVVCWIVTAIGAGTTAYLYLSRPTEEGTNRTDQKALSGLWVAPRFDGSGASLSLRGRL